MTKRKMMTADQIDTSIKSVATRSGRLQNDIHHTAVSILHIWMQQRVKPSFETAKWCADAINRLQGASPYHSNAFSKWVAEFLPLQWSQESKAWYVHKADTKLSGKAFVAARDTPFWKVSPAPAPKPFIMADEINRIIAKVEKHEKKPVEGDAFNISAVKYLREAVKALEASETTTTEASETTAEE